MKRRVVKAFKAVVQHLNEPLEASHPQLKYIPPMLFKLMLYGVVVIVIIRLISIVI